MKVKVSVICKTDFPIYSLEYYINNQKEQLLLGGGGGSGPTGVPNKLVISSYYSFVALWFIISISIFLIFELKMKFRPS
jgi:hypothetical protein